MLSIVSCNYVSPLISCIPTTAPTYYFRDPFVSLTISTFFYPPIKLPDWPQIDNHVYGSKPELHKAGRVEREQLIYIIYHHYPT
jgi:hypothetical protein